MPREKGFMGFGDDRSDQEAYEEGKKESRKSHVGYDVGKIIAGISEDVANSIVGEDVRSSQVKAYDAGWEEGKKDRGEYDYSNSKIESDYSESSYSSDSGYSGGSSSSGAGGGILGGIGCFLFLGVIGFFAYGVFFDPFIIHRWTGQNYPGSSTQRNSIVGTLKRVNTINLNMRSGPGEQFSVVKVFPKNSRIVSYGETRKVGKQTWTQAATDDGQIHGWVNSKYLSSK